MSIRTRIVALAATFGAVAALTVTTGPAAHAATSATVTPASSSVGGSISRSEVISRASSWNGTPYSTTTYKDGPGTGPAYRTDCSGYVSMALHLSGSDSTVSLPSVVTEISASQLQPGDLIGVLGPNTGGNAGHVLIFDGWANAAHTSYIAWEDSGDAGVHQPTIPYPYWPNTSGPAASLYRAYRYNNISGTTGGGGTIPAWPNIVEGNSGADVQALQYLLDAHGASIATDGSFGTNTYNAVVAFQKATSGLGVDGQAGPATLSALIAQVQSGSSGDAVDAAQVELNKYGYGLSVDGSFGANTDNATTSFQASHSPLQVDGQVGPQTWQTLFGD
jgi:Putative peptidoglycan binding domain